MNAAVGRRTTEVAVGVLIGADGRVLLSDRPADKPYTGYWEFPGGKIEAGETVSQALRRELHEELGVEIGSPVPWVTFEFDYPHAYVRLHFCRIWDWQGQFAAREGQRWGLFDLADAPPEPLLPAAVPALRWLRLPPSLVLHSDGSVTATDANGGRDLQPRLRVVCVEALRAGAGYEDGDAVTAAGNERRGWTGAWIETDADLARAAAAGLDFALSRSGRAFTSAPLPLYIASPRWAALRDGSQEGCAHGPLTGDR